MAKRSKIPSMSSKKLIKLLEQAGAVFDREGRGDHIICSPKEEYLGIITAYIPTLDKWENDFRTRRRSK